MNCVHIGFIVVSVFLSTANVHSQDAGSEVADRLQKECVEESGFHGNLSALDPEKDFGPLKCFLKCLMTKTGMMGPDGSLNKEADKLLAEEQTKGNPEEKEIQLKLIEECTSEVTPDPQDLCETAFKYFKCKWDKYQAGKN